MNKGSNFTMNCSTGSEILRNERSSQGETKLQRSIESKKFRLNLGVNESSYSRDILEILFGHGTMNKGHDIPLPQPPENAV